MILEPKKIKSVSTLSPSICHEVMGMDATILPFFFFLNVGFQASFLTLLFHLIKGFFSFSSFSAVRVVSSVYLTLLMFLLAMLIPAYDSSSLAFCMMYTAYKLNKQSDNIQP